MANQQVSEIVERISKIALALSSGGITDASEFARWISEDDHAELVSQAVGYKRKEGMPEVAEVISAHFHPNLPLIMFGYTALASRTLGHFPGSWSPALRQCRGVVFDRSGNLVALPMPKFFNHDEAAAGQVPDDSFVATEMYDGSLGIMFHFDGRWRMATLDGFSSKTADVTTGMLKRRLRSHRWQSVDANLGLMFEIIHPETTHYLKYDWEDMVLIGITDRDEKRDLRFRAIDKMARQLRCPLARAWPGTTLEDLRRLIDRADVKNREGYVARFSNGKRVKFKFRGFIGLMTERHLSYPKLMRNLIDSRAENLARELPEEIHGAALGIIDELKSAQKITAESDRLAYLQGLVPANQRDRDFKSLCLEFLKWLENH